MPIHRRPIEKRLHSAKLLSTSKNTIIYAWNIIDNSLNRKKSDTIKQIHMMLLLLIRNVS